MGVWFYWALFCGSPGIICTWGKKEKKIIIIIIILLLLLLLSSLESDITRLKQAFNEHIIHPTPMIETFPHASQS